jgi:hypothetical protein
MKRLLRKCYLSDVDAYVCSILFKAAPKDTDKRLEVNTPFCSSPLSHASPFVTLSLKSFAIDCPA